MDQESTISSTRKRQFGAIAIVAVVLSVVLVSGGWEFLLKEALVPATNLLLGLVSVAWSGYHDILHREIGKLRVDTLVMLPFSIFATLLLLGPVIAAIVAYGTARRLKRSASEPKLATDAAFDDGRPFGKRRSAGLAVVVGMAVATTVLNAIELSEQSYSRRAGAWADRSIEIVSPRVTSQERHALLADLHSVKSASQYYALYERLNSIAKQNDIVLPAFTPIGLSLKT